MRATEKELGAMLDRFPELVAALRLRFDYNGLRPEHHVVVLANTNTFRPILDAAVVAATSLGAKPVLVVVPWVPPYSAELPSIAEQSLSASDFIIDLQPLTW